MSLYKKQKTEKPKIEEIAANFLVGDNLRNLTNFLEFLKDNKLTPRWQSSNSWKVVYKNRSVCHINLNEREGSWMIRHSQFTRDKWFQNYEKYVTDDELKEFILDNISGPRCVGRGCRGRENMTILGKHFDAVCTCWPLIVTNLDDAELECAKKLILLIKDIIVMPPSFITNPNFKTNLTNLKSNDTEWAEEDDGAFMWGFTGDSFVFSDTQGTDFEYEADLMIESGQAAMLAFRADQNLSNKYFANIDISGVVKLIKPRSEICVAKADIKRGVKYRMKVCADGENIKVYLDGKLKIDVYDDSCRSGYFGVGVFNAKALFQNVNVEIKSIDFIV